MLYSNLVVCTNQLANCTCGFVGVDPNTVVPDWRIIRRNSNGVVVSNETINGGDIIRNTLDGLEWIPDLANANNYFDMFAAGITDWVCMVIKYLAY